MPTDPVARFSSRTTVLIVLFSILTLCLACGESWDTVYAQGQEALERGDAEAARASFQKILDYQPTTPAAIEGMTAVCRLQSATDELVYWSRELIRYRPWDREANLVVGQALVDEGNLKDAVVRFMLAYQNSEFKNDRREALEKLDEVRRQLAGEVETTTGEVPNDSTE